MTKKSISLFCSIKSCNGKSFCRGWCSAHYHRWQRYGDPLKGGNALVLGQGETEEERFWSRVNKAAGQGKDGDCWEWAGFVNSKRPRGKEYGTVVFDKVKWRTHRYAYFSHYKVHPGEMLVCHTCDNPPCCNPAHLFLGTTQTNALDKFAKGRGYRQTAEFCVRGEAQGSAKLTADIVRTMRNRYQNGESVAALAREYGVADVTADRAIHRRNWKHVE